ncbi:SGNH/GDSL hydrolase family protein [Rubinisphaera margarita]|uniref:SGNH/GDSL hydrolase family protein n=1 Tax=Rubinisphaera margarita TaxID=2909586 RepID=UPI001EE9134B|nr:SGNH/GDSL hydrolase family protein [Rubinisphaera margarita]MCG6155583.1 SGNH/GDSL hydrolase family protein [Rubinisphaera margarita]
MPSSNRPIHVRLDRYSRRRRLLLVSCDMASNPSAYDEYVDEQILLDPEVVKLVNASAEYMASKLSYDDSIVGAASTLIKGSATGSAVLADFPDVEYEMVPPGGHSSGEDENEDPASIFDDAGRYAAHAQQNKSSDTPQKSAETVAETPKPVVRPKVSQPVTPAAPRRDLKDLLDKKPIVGGDNLNKIRGWLHQSQSRVWMFVGDDTTAWLRYHGEPGYVEMFRHRIRWELRRFPDLIVNAGVRRASIDDLIKITTQGLLQCRADAVFFMPGRTDVKLAVESPFDYSERLRHLAELIRSQGAEPVFQTPPVPVVEESDESSPLLQLADLIREVAIVEGIPLIDHAEFWQEQKQAGWISGEENGVSTQGQQALSMLFFSELDLFDRSSQLCSKIQSMWSTTVNSRSSAVPASHS